MVVNRSVYFVAVGGNLPIGEGSPILTLSLALRDMVESGLVIRAVSRFYETPCYPPGAGPDFANAVVEIACDLEPRAVLQHLHGIEARFGRERNVRWGARTLDLDLIGSGARIVPDAETARRWIDLDPQDQQKMAPDQLVLPHPRLQDRAFVLVPLCDIAPGWRHPVLGQTAQALCAALPRAEIDAIRPR